MADQIKATPRSPILGLFSDIVNLPLQYMSSPERTQQSQGVAQFLYGTGIPKTLERMSYGDSLFSGAGGLGGTTRMRPETAEALMNVAPLAPVAGRLASQTGRTVGRLAGQEINAAMTGQPTRSLLGQITPKPLRMADTSYRGQHTAPSPDFGAPLHDLSQIYPDDIYSSKAAQYYGGSVPYDQKAVSIAQQYRNKPDALVTIYRAVPKEKSNSEKLAEIEKQMAAYMRRGTLPKDAENYSSGSQWYDNAYEMREKLRQMPDEMSQGINDINAGDWVTLTREYAKDHGESALRGQYKILSKKVKAKELWTNADSIHEFGYQPEATASPQPFSYPQQAALDLAQQRAALPVSEGGLGLPANNTAMDRARAMGFNKDVYHGAQNEITNIDFALAGQNTGNPNAKLGFFTTPNTEEASRYATLHGNKTNANVIPLVAKSENSYQMPYKELDDLAMAAYNLMMQSPDYNPNEVIKFGDMVAQKAAAERLKKYRDIASEKSLQRKNELMQEGFDSATVLQGKPMEEFIIFNPDSIRSRFAAFDPFRKDVATATAMGVALPDLLAQPVDQYQQTYETTPMYTDPFGNTIGSSIR